MFGWDPKESHLIFYVSGFFYIFKIAPIPNSQDFGDKWGELMNIIFISKNQQAGRAQRINFVVMKAAHLLFAISRCSQLFFLIDCNLIWFLLILLLSTYSR